MKQRVLIIGSGRRVRECFFPAFSVLSDRFEIAGVHSRRRELLDDAIRPWGLTAVYDLKIFDFSKIDVVVVSISKPQILSVLKAISSRSRGLTLVIDTPVFCSLKDFLYIGLLRKYRNVIVTEDYMNFPQFTFVRSVVESGLIGDPIHVNLMHSGWSYHGLALIRSFFAFSHATRITSRPIADGCRVLHLRFPNGKSASIFDPYDPDRGSFMIAGEKGNIVSYPLQAKNTSVFSSVFEHGLFKGYRIDCHDGRVLEYMPKNYAALVAIDFPNKCQFNLEKVIGLIDILDSNGTSGLNQNYGYLEGLYDHLVSKMIYKFSIWFDPVAYFGKNLLRLLNVFLFSVIALLNISL